MAHSGDLSGVLADLSRLTGRVEALEGLPEQIATLAELLDQAVGEQGEPEGPAKVPAAIWWPSLNGDSRVLLEAELRGWLREVAAGHYGHEIRDLAPCWAQHPAVVDALTAAWLTWAGAYRSGDPDAAAEWQLRWRPELLAVAVRLTGECRRAERHVAPEALNPELLDSFAEPAQH